MGQQCEPASKGSEPKQQRKGTGGWSAVRRQAGAFLERNPAIVKMACACGVTLLLVWLLFLFAQGPAYIYFSAAEEQSPLSGLRSQSIQIQAESAIADASQQQDVETALTAQRIQICSQSLSSWITGYLQENGVAVCEDPNLRIVSRENACRIELDCAQTDRTARYVMEEVSAVVDPVMSQALSGSIQGLMVYPCLYRGEGYESFSSGTGSIRIKVPADEEIVLLLGYTDDRGRERQMEIDPTELPDYTGESGAEYWTFELTDSFLRIEPVDRGSLQMDIAGRFVLDLWATGVSKVYAYLSGDLLFQYAGTPQNFTLTEQLTAISGNDLNLVLRKGIRTDEPEEKLLINGEATKMEVSGVDLFPTMRMWFRENVYVAPLALLSVIISVYKLPEKKREKDSEKQTQE